MHPSPDTEEGKETLKHSFGNTRWPTQAGGSQGAQGKDRVYKCVLCPERPWMKNKASSRRHVEYQHYPTQYHSCPDCEVDAVQTLFTRDRLEEHMRDKHIGIQATK
ncbi:hypothetical protein ASPVEDRAFT_375489 [Aspergillus versicolor CBS 583.65]|uniref:Uncharacterized protein n=1 Tax=Aspergillus versicolor CBS 583.65 TaxID=1036611 RepID=A0A1L9Q236_ASPVE|nr:uncharacterized protein ASPVEDRAFT_375489 [Aspergillus versicolor CBS 583.65]OJJ07823.1 hypothetical protein ASPVEDRAFT_375489 [Aspergillus versicolor CBS 583.65]